MPAFYLCKVMAAGGTAAFALSEYRRHIWADMQAIWVVWIPAQLINFSVSPARGVTRDLPPHGRSDVPMLHATAGRPQSLCSEHYQGLDHDLV